MEVRGCVAVSGVPLGLRVPFRVLHGLSTRGLNYQTIKSSFGV